MSPLGERSFASGSTATRIYEHLRNRIISMELEPDTTLSRIELAREYGVSQMPVREAMQRLEQDGLIRIYPQSKTIVARIDTLELQENQFLRIALEIEVARRLAEQRNEATVKQAGMIIKMQESILDDLSEIQLFNDLDRQFHSALFDGVGMKTLHQMILSKLGHLARCQRLELPLIGKRRDILNSHKAIVEAIHNGAPVKAVKAMRTHLTGTISRIESLRKAYPDYFV
ncbi:MAG: GntR family transcriptional regulator [Hyphomicrobiales bacterium]|nr:GntR family transcriptional regulator [Hyphomicrobiales bacterium]